MRILTGIDLPFRPNCGSMIFCNDIYGFARESGHEIGFVALQPSDHGWANYNSVYLMDIPKSDSEDGFYEYIEKIRGYTDRIIDDFKPDIIHLQHLNFGLSRVFAEQVKIPKLAICHGTDIEFAESNSYLRKNFEFIINRVDHVIMPSKAMLKRARKLAMAEFSYEVANWGIPMPLNPTYPNFNTDPFKILYAGRLSKNKSVDTILEALTYLDSNFKLTIVGEGLERSNLVNLSKYLSISERVEFLRFLPRKELWEFMSGFQVIIIPTRNLEAFGLIAIEAQSMGLPVITSGVDGLGEVLGDSSITFTPGDARGLADRIIFLAGSSEKWLNLQSRGIENAKLYDIRNISQNIILKSNRLIP